VAKIYPIAQAVNRSLRALAALDRAEGQVLASKQGDGVLHLDRFRSWICDTRQIVRSGCSTPTFEEKKAVQFEVAPRHVNGSKPIGFHRVLFRLQQGEVPSSHFRQLCGQQLRARPCG